MWEPTQSNPMCDHDGDVEFKLTARQEVGIAQFRAEKGNTFAELAKKLEVAWNENPIGGIEAKALEGPIGAMPPKATTAFSSDISYAKEDIKMEATFPAQPCAELNPTATWIKGKTKLTRVPDAGDSA